MLTSLGTLQDQLKQSRTTQVASTQLLAKLLEAPNTSATAKKHVNDINEEFFMVASTYMDMVRKVLHNCLPVLQLQL